MTERLNAFAVTLAQLNPTMGDIEGNAAKARAARAQASRRWRRSRAVSGIVHRRLSAGRSRAEAGLPGRLPRRDRSARARDRRRRPGDAGRHALGRGRQALQCLRAARRRAHRRVALQVQSAELRRVRREAAVCARARAQGPSPCAACASACRSARTSGWKSPRTTRTWSRRWPRPAPRSSLVPNGSPYARDKNDVRLSVAVARVTESGLPLVYLNQVCGQDELVFDGASFALNGDLSLAAQLPAFEESVTTLRFIRNGDDWRCTGPIARAARGRPGRLCGLRAGLARLCRARTAFPACCSASPAASIPRCARRSRSMRSAPTRCTA